MKQVILALLLAASIGAAFVAYSGFAAFADPQNVGNYRADAPSNTQP
jgi:hypothetical protein